MKKSELRQLIREEIQRLKENSTDGLLTRNEVGKIKMAAQRATGETIYHKVYREEIHGLEDVYNIFYIGKRGSGYALVSFNQNGTYTIQLANNGNLIIEYQSRNFTEILKKASDYAKLALTKARIPRGI